MTYTDDPPFDKREGASDTRSKGEVEKSVFQKEK
jgi:hypothetical protein